MSPFQVILIVLLAGLLAFVVQAGVRRTIGRPFAVITSIILLVGILAAIAPDRTTTISRAVGISRGTDLVLYVLVLAVLQGFLVFYLRLRKVRRELTLLVRRLAILEAPQNDNRRSDPS